MSDLINVLKKLKNPQKFGLTFGVITENLPNVKIDIGNGIILDKKNLLFSASILKNYKRAFEIKSKKTTIKGKKWKFQATPVLNDTVIASLRPVPLIPEGQPIMFDLDVDNFESEGELTLKDEIKKGDNVMLISTESNQLFFVIDKVVSF